VNATSKYAFLAFKDPSNNLKKSVFKNLFKKKSSDNLKFLVNLVKISGRVAHSIRHMCDTKYLQIQGADKALTLPLCSTLEYFKMAMRKFSRIFSF